MRNRASEATEEQHDRSGDEERRREGCGQCIPDPYATRMMERNREQERREAHSETERHSSLPQVHGFIVAPYAYRLKDTWLIRIQCR